MNSSTYDLAEKYTCHDADNALKGLHRRQSSNSSPHKQGEEQQQQQQTSTTNKTSS